MAAGQWSSTARLCGRIANAESPLHQYCMQVMELPDVPYTQKILRQLCAGRGLWILSLAESEKVLQREISLGQQAVALCSNAICNPWGCRMYAMRNHGLGWLVRPINHPMSLRLSGCCRALKNSQGQQAMDHYSKALELEPPPSIPFAAVLYANRAAAEQSLGQHAKAIADCLRATALKPDYAKVTRKLHLTSFAMYAPSCVFVLLSSQHELAAVLCADRAAAKPSCCLMC